jgi:hypothetical protein
VVPVPPPTPATVRCEGNMKDPIICLDCRHPFDLDSRNVSDWPIIDGYNASEYCKTCWGILAAEKGGRPLGQVPWREQKEGPGIPPVEAMKDGMVRYAVSKTEALHVIKSRRPLVPPTKGAR